MSPELVALLRHRLTPAVPVPFAADGTLNEPVLRSYARWMAAQDVGAVAVWTHTGRGLRLTEEQRACVLTVWRAAAPATPIVCGVGVPHDATLPSDPGRRTDSVIAATVRMTEAAKQGGAAAVLVHPPTALRDLPDVGDRVADLHRTVASFGLPVIAFYLYQAAGGIAYAPETVERLLATDGVIGIKVATLDSLMTFQDLAATVRRVPGALLVTGEDRFLGYSLMLGADAALVGVGAAGTDVSAALLRSWFARDLHAFVRLSTTVDAFARHTFVAPMEGYVQRTLWALEADGVIPPGAHDPFAPPLAAAEPAAVAEAVRSLRRR